MNLAHLYLLTIGVVSAHAECENDWTPYKDELCIKVFNSYLDYNSAKDFCSSQGDTKTHSSLVMVKDEDLQDLLADYTKDANGNIWLGGMYDERTTQFIWQDGEPLSYTNWQEGYPRNITDGDACIELRTSNNKWTGAMCLQRNLVVCQRPMQWTLEDAVEIIMEMRKELQATRDELQAVNSLVVPVGSIYIEYANQVSPPKLWPSLRWKDITSTYAGLFFRAFGGESAGWGVTQSDCATNIAEMRYTYRADGGYPPTINISANGWSEVGMAGGFISGNWNRAEGIQFRTEGCEIRPRNQAVRIWRRVA